MKNTILALLALIFISSCAQIQDLDNDELLSQSFKAWVANNDPDAVPLNGDDEIYIRYIKHGPAESDTLDIVDYSWYRLDYSVYNFNGDLIATRDSLIAKRDGVWAATTHWVPDYLEHRDENSIYCDGLHDVIETLTKGDEVRVYVSTYKAFVTETMGLNEGYVGTTTAYTGFPIYYDLKVGDISHYPYMTEKDSLASYIAQWGLEMKDSIADGIYKRTIVENPEGSKLGSDSLAVFRFEEYFPDEFLIKTNVAEVADSLDREQESPDGVSDPYALTSSYVSLSANLSPLYVEALLSMRKGEKAEFYSLSKNTPYGTSGVSSNVPQIPALQPIKLVLSVYDTIIK